MRKLLLLLTFFVCLLGLAGTSTARLTIKARLVEGSTYNMYCGVMSLAAVHKFEILESNPFFGSPGTFVLLQTLCPGEYGSGFFVTNKKYEIEIYSRENIPGVGIVINPYEKENLPVFHTKHILPITK